MTHSDRLMGVHKNHNSAETIRGLVPEANCPKSWSPCGGRAVGPEDLPLERILLGVLSASARRAGTNWDKFCTDGGKLATNPRALSGDSTCQRSKRDLAPT